MNKPAEKEAPQNPEEGSTPPPKSAPMNPRLAVVNETGRYSFHLDKGQAGIP